MIFTEPCIFQHKQMLSVITVQLFYSFDPGSVLTQLCVTEAPLFIFLFFFLNCIDNMLYQKSC